MSAVERAEGAAAGAASGAFRCCVMLYEIVVSGCTLFGSCIKRCPAPVVSAVLRILNLANAVLLGAVCYFAFQTITGGDVTRTFLAIYCGLFGLLLALFETRVPYTAPFIAKNCGFLFTAGGRTAFLIFLGAVCFGLLPTGTSVSTYNIGYNMSLGAGIATFCNAFFNCFIICNHPGFQEINAAASAPAGNDPSKMSEADVKKYLEMHPEIAAAALGAAKPPAFAAPGGSGGDADWVKAAEARAAAEGSGGAKPAKASSGWGWGGGGGGSSSSAAGGSSSTSPKRAMGAPAASAPPDTYVPPVVPFTAAAPRAAAAPPPPVPGFAADIDNPFAS